MAWATAKGALRVAVVGFDRDCQTSLLPRSEDEDRGVRRPPQRATRGGGHCVGFTTSAIRSPRNPGSS